MNTRQLSELLLLAAIWGGSFLFMRVAVPEFGPIALIAVRVAVAAVFLGGLLAIRGQLAALRSNVKHMLIVGALNSALPFTLYAYATLSVTAGFAAVLNATAPLFGALVAYFWLREALPLSRIIGLLVGFCGVLILVWSKISFKDGGSGWAVVAGLVAALSYGIVIHYTKRYMAKAEPLVVACGSQITATILLLPLAIWKWPAVLPGTSSWLSVIALGMLCTGIAYILYFRLLNAVGASKTIAVTYLIPAFGILWGSLFLHEQLTTNMLTGGAVIMLGTALTTGILKWKMKTGS